MYQFFELLETLRKSVCYLAYKDGAGREKFGGTAFFVSVEFDDTLLRFYLVTARHCYEKWRGETERTVRFNKVDGSSVHVNTNQDWLLPEDSSIDIAVTPFEPTGDVDWNAVPQNIFADSQEKVVGVGAQLLSVGLFSAHPGQIRNEPIVRTGILAAKPAKGLQDDAGKDYFPYLAELRSTGGLSGSPVFISYRPADTKSLLEVAVGDDETQLRLIGIVRGHFDLRAGKAFETQGEEGSIHTGIAIVEPVGGLIELLSSENAKAQRKAILKKQSLPPQTER